MLSSYSFCFAAKLPILVIQQRIVYFYFDFNADKKERWSMVVRILLVREIWMPFSVIKSTNPRHLLLFRWKRCTFALQ